MYLKTTPRLPLNKFVHWFIHFWKVKHNNGHTKYFECSCGARKCTQPDTGYQPVDLEWVTLNSEELKAAP